MLGVCKIECLEGTPLYYLSGVGMGRNGAAGKGRSCTVMSAGGMAMTLRGIPQADWDTRGFMLRKQTLLRLQHCMFHGFNALHEVLL